MPLQRLISMAQSWDSLEGMVGAMSEFPEDLSKGYFFLFLPGCLTVGSASSLLRVLGGSFFESHDCRLRNILQLVPCINT